MQNKYNRKKNETIKLKIKEIIDMFFKYERVNHDNIKDLEKAIKAEVAKVLDNKLNATSNKEKE